MYKTSVIAPNIKSNHHSIKSDDESVSKKYGNRASLIIVNSDGALQQKALSYLTPKENNNDDDDDKNKKNIKKNIKKNNKIDEFIENLYSHLYEVENRITNGKSNSISILFYDYLQTSDYYDVLYNNTILSFYNKLVYEKSDLVNHYIHIIKESNYGNLINFDQKNLKDKNIEKDIKYNIPYIHSELYRTTNNFLNIGIANNDKRTIETKIILAGILPEDIINSGKIDIYIFGNSSIEKIGSLKRQRINFRFQGDNKKGIVQGDLINNNGLYVFRLKKWYQQDSENNDQRIEIDFTSITLPISFMFKGILYT
jgi:hypothetical protein